MRRRAAPTNAPNNHGDPFTTSETNGTFIHVESKSFPARKRHKPILMIVVLSVFVGVVIGVVLMSLFASRSSNAHSKITTLFDTCRDPYIGYDNNDAPCAYFRPQVFLKDPDMISKHQSEFQRSLEDVNVKWSVYNFQVANFGNHPRLGFSYYKDALEFSKTFQTLSDSVESVAMLAAPKCGSRSLYELFLSHVAVPSAAMQYSKTKPTPRVGHFDTSFVKELSERQLLDGIVVPQSATTAFNSWSS